MAGVEFLVGGWFASPVIKSVFDKAEKFLSDNYELQKDTQKMVEKLIHTLSELQATVTEAEKKVIINNPELANWLSRLKQVAYEAEDVLDNMETQSIKDKVKAKNKVSKLASSSLSTVGNILFPDDNLKSLKRAVDKLNEYYSKIPNFVNLVNMNNKNESQTREVTDSRETTSEPLVLYGRQDELKLILDIISGTLSESSEKGIISGTESESSKKGGQNYNNYHGIFVILIVGMGGVGKTALAQAVYNNTEVQKTFEKRAWISVSNKPNVIRVMGEIYESFSPNSNLGTLAYQSKESISKLLRGVIGGDKFLIVLDDMFGSDQDFADWNLVHAILSGGVPGSVVLITTQNNVFANRVVGNTVGAIGPIALRALDSGVFWELFKHFAFGNVEMPGDKREILQRIGKKIADKLHGLPLAAKIIGNVLNSGLIYEQSWADISKSWADISESEWWHIPDVESQILPSIGLGYEHLNPSLRQCFAYCSLFPRNSLIEKDRLVHMWIAHNFIQPDVNGVKRLEDIGRQWFDELVKKSFFQRAWDNNSYVMHELMHDLAVIVSSGECFYLGEGVANIPSGVRHLAVDTNNLEVIRGIQEHKNLRSFLYYGCRGVEGLYNAIQDTLCHLNSIRVLDLSYMHMENNNKPPYTIWNLQHLRFLDLSSTGINVLTDHSSINLYHLQALYIRKCHNFKELPKGINKLINLRHLYAKEETIAQISGIGQLTNLQELGVFIVREKKGYTITELENLREIGGTLIIKNFENIKNKDEAKLANLVNKKHLDSIRIIANNTERNSNEDMEVLQELQPNKDIKDLRINSYAGLDFPNWIIQIGDHFVNLNTLYLISCVNVKVLPPLGELPSLKHLQIEKFDSVKQIDSHLYGNNQTVFPFLEVLVLDTLSDCEEWTDAGATEFFPRLSKLTIKFNSILRKAPFHLFSSTLKGLKIYCCESLISLGNSMPNLSSITHLELSSSPASISLDLLNMPFLEDLNLMDCPELKIEGGLQSLTHLKRLRLDSCPNLFSTYSTRDQQKGKGLQVHQDAGLRSLTYIEADYSLWNHEYHLILGSLPSLWASCFKNSEFTRFTDDQILWFQELTSLKEIHFSNCKFKHLPASLALLSSLKKMVLSECQLESISDSIPPNLQELYLSGNSGNFFQLCSTVLTEEDGIERNLVIHIDDATRRENRKIPDAHEMKSMTIRKPFSDAIGLHACASCGKTFELTDFVLRDYISTFYLEGKKEHLLFFCKTDREEIKKTNYITILFF